MGSPPRPPVRGRRGIEWPPRGRPPRPPPRREPSEIRCPRAWPVLPWGAVLPLLFLRALVGADRPRPPRAPCSARAGGRWLSPGRGPAARGAGAVNGLIPAGGENGEKRLASRSPAADAAPAQCAGAPFLAGKAAPFRKLVHFPVKFACPPPPMCYTGGRSKDLTKIEERPPAKAAFSLLDNIGGNCRAQTFEIGAFSELFAAAQ